MDEPQRHRGHRDSRSRTSEGDFAERTFASGLQRTSYAIIGAAIEVHRNLGPGFLEAAYDEALAVELTLRGVSFRRQFGLALFYKGHRVSESRLDFLVEDRVVVELKAVDSLAPIHKAQIISYLKAGKFALGLLINFNVPLLRDGIIRVIEI